MSAPKKFVVDLPCGVFYDLENLVLDLNGTLTSEGKFIEGTVERLKEISKALNIYILTADTYQTLDQLKAAFKDAERIEFKPLESGRGDLQKLSFLEELGREHTAAIGNGCNDALLLKEAALGICIVGKEGASTEALLASNAIFNNICDALDIFLHKNRMIATLRK